MKNDFICPKCRGFLNLGDRVIFTIKKKGWSGGLLLLSPELGEYSYENHSSYKIDPGEQFEFHCPICQFDLSIEGTENLAKVLLREDGKNEFYVVFSKREGERCTYKISETKVEESFGEHSSRNMDLLSASFFR